MVSESGSGGGGRKMVVIYIYMFRIQKIKRPCCSVLGPSINTTKMSRQFSFFAWMRRPCRVALHATLLYWHKKKHNSYLYNFYKWYISIPPCVLFFLLILFDIENSEWKTLGFIHEFRFFSLWFTYHSSRIQGRLTFGCGSMSLRWPLPFPTHHSNYPTTSSNVMPSLFLLVLHIASFPKSIFIVFGSELLCDP